MNKYNKQKGFTLIELLVVISIIALLSSVVLTSLGSARIKARDARRLSDLRQMQLALELYYADNGEYFDWWANSDGGGWSTLATALATYISPLPVDPTNVDPLNYGYISSSATGNQMYGLYAPMESPSNLDLVQNDGGFYNNVDGTWYEIGPLPSYCMTNYSESWYTGQANACDTQN